MLEPVQVASWEDFWGSFEANLSEGLNRLKVPLEAGGLSVPEETVRCTVTSPTSAVATAEEETAGWLGGGERAVKVLVDAGGIFEWILGTIPVLTSRGTFVHHGQEKALLGQLARAPGVFLHSDEEGARWAVARPQVGAAFQLELGKRNCRIAFGGRGSVCSVERLARLLDGDDDALDAESLRELALAVGAGSTSLVARDCEPGEVLANRVRTRLSGWDLGEVGTAQLDRRLERLGLSPCGVGRLSAHLLTTMETLLREFAAHETEAADDVCDLGNLRVRLIGEFLDDALATWLMRLQRRIARAARTGSGTTFANALRSENLNQGGDTLFAECVRSYTVGQRICQSVNADSSSYLQRAALTRRLTFNGAIDVASGPKGRRARDFHWSHIGRLCPFDTSMGVDVGVTLSLASGARVNGFGQIEARCWRVEHGADGRARVTADEEWISPWQEDAQAAGWIALPDERAALERGDQVWAHRGRAGLRRVAASEVSHIHTSEDEMLSMAALLVPYRQHNDASRTTMSCNFLRQALPLKEKRPPRVATGAEAKLPSVLAFNTQTETADGLVFGADLRVGYAIWKGWNYEDAIAISDSAAGALSSTHFWNLPPIALSRPLAGQQVAFASLGKSAESDYLRFDENGALRRGERVRIGQPVLIEALPNWKGRGKATIVEYVVPKPESEWQWLAMSDELVVHRTIVGDDDSGLARVRVVLRDERRATVGDKLVNRHGHKGVISRVFADHEMPYFLLPSGERSACPCGEPRPHVHLQVLINPLSVLSRMNLGQLFETIAARDGTFKDLPQKVACFDPMASGEHQLEGDILVGVQYVMKLDHNAADKINARNNGVRGYSTSVQQPLRGRRHDGGQRLGEMELWALQAHGVPNLLQELLTLKSDNPRARRDLAADLAAGTNEAKAELPEALRTLAALCYGLGLDLLLKDSAGRRLDPMLDLLSPQAADELVIGLLEQDYFLKRVSKGEVASPRIGGSDQNPKVRYHPAGLESESIFGPTADYTCACGAHRLDTATADSKRAPKSCPKCKTQLISSGSRRRRMAHVRLARTVPNPFLLLSAPLRLESDMAQPLWVSFRQAVDESPSVAAIVSGLFSSRLRVSFATKGMGGPESAGAEVRKGAAQFLTLAAYGSQRVREALAMEVGASIRLPVRRAERGALGAALAGFEVRSGPGEERSLFLEEAIEKYLPPVGDVRFPRKIYGEVVNEILEAAADVPVDFVCSLLGVSSLGAALLSIVPVIPPKLRQKTVFGPNDLTVHYQSLLRANADLAASDETSDAYRSLRRTHFVEVARLMANQLLPCPLQASDRSLRRLESLSSRITGKSGLVAGHLLGKRVDFSGRAVIVPDPSLPMDQCRLPFALAVKLFRPLLRAKLRARIEAEQEGRPKAEELEAAFERRLKFPGALEPDSKLLLRPLLEELFADYPVLINRQPTLHRLGMLAFWPALGEGDVIALSTLVLKGFNADFDGDQVAVHLPLLKPAREDALRMLPSKHIWHPRNGSYALSQSQDLALGAWRLSGKSAGAVASDFEARVGEATLVESIEAARAQAFDAATRSGVSFSPEDLQSIAMRLRGQGAASTEAVLTGLGRENPVFQIIQSGARGDATVLGYIAGKRFESRERSNLTQGLTLGERLTLVASESRPNLVATKLATGEGGYLTKRMVDWAQYVQVVEGDCGATVGIEVRGQIPSSVGDATPAQALERELVLRWLYGRTIAQDVEGIAAGSVLGRDQAERLAEWLSEDPGHAVTIRSPLFCKLDRGVCRACYGAAPSIGRGHRQLDRSDLAAHGTSAGLIAAQSIGEPFTQAALHRKHSIGVESDEEDIGALVQKLVNAFIAAGDQCAHLRDLLKVEQDLLRVVQRVQLSRRAHGVLLGTSDREEAFGIVEEVATTSGVGLAHITPSALRQFDSTQMAWAQASVSDRSPIEMLAAAREQVADQKPRIVILEELVYTLRDESQDVAPRIALSDLLAADLPAGIVLVLIEGPQAEAQLPPLISPQIVKLQVGYSRAERVEQSRLPRNAYLANLTLMVAGIDSLIFGPRIEVAIIHLEMLVRGLALREKSVAWIGDLAAPTGEMESRLARAAMKSATDRLRDPRAQLVVGGQVTGLGAN